MLTPEMLANLSRTYSEDFLRWCRAPAHCRWLPAFHARGEHRAANGDWIEFRLRLSDGVITELGFGFEGRPVLLVGAMTMLGTGWLNGVLQGGGAPNVFTN